MTEADSDVSARRAAERAARESYGRLVAFLAGRTGRIAEAEDALSEAMIAALRQWPRTGIPQKPDAWLLAVARRRQADGARRMAAAGRGEQHLLLLGEERDAMAADEIPDRRLSLMFACAHPDIDERLRAPLMLQTILGLTAAEIGAAFLTPPATMAQRLVRAKSRIADIGIPFSIPDREDMAARLDAVLTAIYAAFSRDWAGSEEHGDCALADEAIWLGRVVVSLLPDEAEAEGLLSLMLFIASRSEARGAAAGVYVPLDEQDTSLWSQGSIAEASARLRHASSHGATGRYQIEAAIQSAHVARRLHGVDTRADVLALYDLLVALVPSPVVVLNRSLALGDVEGPVAALASIAGLETDARMLSFQPYWATLAHLRARSGDRAGAIDAYRMASGLTVDQPTREFLRKRIAALMHG